MLGGDGEDAGADVRVLAQALETRHPRHVKRFLNDLSITLAVLRNTGKLGEGEEQLPEPAVVAWHLLSEVLPEDRWREVRALPQNLRKFLTDMKELEAKEGKEREPEAGVDAEEPPPEWTRIRAAGLPERHLKALHDLTDRQRHLLVYLATPSAVEAEPAKRRRTPKRHDLFDLDSAAWVKIPGGTFLMGAQNAEADEPGYDPEAHGDESPVHEVELNAYHLSRHPVTNAEFAVYVNETGNQAPSHWDGDRIPEGKESHPVVYVPWDDAVAFCEWISRRLSMDGNTVVSLPTEAQWEFAARGGEGRRYPWGDAEPSDELANFGMNVGDTTPVASYPDGATPEGVHDLAGNVWEWCLDRYEPYSSEPRENPKTGSSRVLRGGAFNDVLRLLRASSRYDNPPMNRTRNVGFRLRVSPSVNLEP